MKILPVNIQSNLSNPPDEPTRFLISEIKFSKKNREFSHFLKRVRIQLIFSSLNYMSTHFSDIRY